MSVRFETASRSSPARGGWGEVTPSASPRAAPRSWSATSAGRRALHGPQKVVGEIVAAGGEALANGADVTNAAEVARWLPTRRRGGAGSTCWSTTPASCATSRSPTWDRRFRDRGQSHLIGSATCTKRGLERNARARLRPIVFTSSASGIYGNFGQANYGAAKAGDDRPDERAAPGRRQIRYPRQHARAHRGNGA